jgi:hypothetical protein
MWFKLENCKLDYIERAPFNLKNSLYIPVSPERVFNILAGDTWKEWFQDFVGVKWLTPEESGTGSMREVKLKTLSVKETFLAWEPGKRYSFLVGEITLPLVKAMVEDIQLEPSGDEGTTVNWNVYYTPTLFMSLIHPVPRSIFGKMFSKSLENLGKFCQQTVNT